MGQYFYRNNKDQREENLLNQGQQENDHLYPNVQVIEYDDMDKKQQKEQEQDQKQPEPCQRIYFIYNKKNKKISYCFSEDVYVQMPGFIVFHEIQIQKSKSMEYIQQLFFIYQLFGIIKKIAASEYEKNMDIPLFRFSKNKKNRQKYQQLGEIILDIQRLRIALQDCPKKQQIIKIQQTFDIYSKNDIYQLCQNVYEKIISFQK